MNKLLCASIFIFCFSLFAFAQTQNYVCPEIKVLGPDGLVKVGETITFSATIDGKTPNSNMEFEWTVSQGTILDQQGLPEIRVMTTKEMEGSNVTVKVKVKGLFDCNKEASETAVIESLPSDHGNPPYQYSKSSLEEEFERIDNLLVTLQNIPQSTGYILFEIEKTEDLGDVKKRLKKIFSHIFVKRKINRSLISYDICYAEDNTTSFYIILEGASLPEIPNCKRVDIDLK